MYRQLAVSVFILLLFSSGAISAGDTPAPKDAQRILLLLAVAETAYGGAVGDTRVVRFGEIQKALNLLADAREIYALSGAAVSLLGTFDHIKSAMQAKASVNVVQEATRKLRISLLAATGGRDEIFPPQAPSAARGQALYTENCAPCHGVRGDGNGPQAAGLYPRPATFAALRFMRAETPLDCFCIVSLGKKGTAMAAWDDALSVQERWDVVRYVWTFEDSPGELIAGERLYRRHCAECHGATGEAIKVWRGGATAKPATSSRLEVLARVSDAELFGLITGGASAATMHSFATQLTEPERWDIVRFLRLLSFSNR